MYKREFKGHERMQDYGLVSIITPSWNCAQFICDTINSVRAQTYQNWEMIIVDDGSTDNTTEVVRPYVDTDSRIHFYLNDVNSGAAISRNNALKKARGRWIAFLDSDDYWEPTKLEKQIRFMENNGYKFSYTNYSEIDSEGDETGIYVSGPPRITKAGMFAFCWPGCLTVMYDALTVGLVQIEDIKKNNDYAMWLKVCKIADCYLLPEILAKYRRGRIGSVSTHSIFTMMKWHYKLFRDAEHMSITSSLWHTCINLVCGLYKKLRFVRKGTVSR